MSDSEDAKKKEPAKPSPGIKPLPDTEVRRDLAKAIKKKDEK